MPKCKEQEPSRDHKFSILENVAFLRDCTSATLPHFEVALVGARPLYLAAQDRTATQTPRWGVRCFANAVLLGRAEPQTLLLTIWKLHDYAPLGPRELTLIGGIEL